ncbi:hypothetical protein SADUNF_Sadunf07G0038200 [Salix dunnii]|uniref:Uncharacterized protein n=1 Tax=Salix dunnii TaxID=1413687 RepID=A0A835MVL8_9ROSI|nr:hypothetical protein SADUNF_Sadunf07G0038200 [Salix dunnii]
MATTRVITGAFVVLFFLILCREAVRVEGRPLKSEMCKKCSTNNDNSVNVPENGNHGLADGQEKTSKVNYVEDFRPTEPGLNSTISLQAYIFNVIITIQVSHISQEPAP